MFQSILLFLVVMTMEDEELTPLKTLYDELWSDAKTMIKDMNRSISMYFFAGLMGLAMSVVAFGSTISNIAKILSGAAGALEYFYAISTSLGSVILVIYGISMLRWYNKLKNRYSRLMQMEKTIED